MKTIDSTVSSRFDGTTQLRTISSEGNERINTLSFRQNGGSTRGVVVKRGKGK